MSGGVDAKQLTRYIEIEKEVQLLESQNVLKNYEVKHKAAVDVEETMKSMELTLKQLQLNTRKEKRDVDDMQNKTLKDMFKDEALFQRELNREQEEYLEARNREEVARQQLADLNKQHGELEGQANAIKGPADKLTKLYEERDGLLSNIFGGDYGSDLENKLEALFDSLMDQKQRISVAYYKWTSARVLLHHAVSQLAHSVQKWKELQSIPPQNCPLKYMIATEVRNYNIAAIANVRSCAPYLGEKIEFPYCKENEMQTMCLATQNVYIDMQDPQRHQHALQCYDVTWRRAAALMQWFDNVIANTIQKDMTKITEEGRKVEKDLRAERIKLIREKIKESGGDVSGLNDTGLKGLTDGFSNIDQTKLSEADMDMKGVGITRPAPVDGGPNVPDAQNQGPPPAPAPTPLPLSELAPMPSQSDIFGDISALKEQYAKNTEEYLKAQQLNKTRMEQGLQAKLAERRHKKHA